MMSRCWPSADEPPVTNSRPSGSTADATSRGISPNSPPATHVPVGTCGTSARSAYPNVAIMTNDAAATFAKRCILELLQITQRRNRPDVDCVVELQLHRHEGNRA